MPLPPVVKERLLADLPPPTRSATAKRTLQDFLTKDWSLGTAMESIEMNETHNVFERAETVAAVEAAGFVEPEWIPFKDIRGELDGLGGELVEGEPWPRKFLLVARKPDDP